MQEERRGRLQNLRLKGARKKGKQIVPIGAMALETVTSDNSNCDKNYYSNKNDVSTENLDCPSAISDCLKYAKEVSDIFSHSIMSEKEKWKNLKNRDGECTSNEEIIWKQAKRFTKMIFLGNELLQKKFPIFCNLDNN